MTFSFFMQNKTIIRYLFPERKSLDDLFDFHFSLKNKIAYKYE